MNKNEKALSQLMQEVMNELSKRHDQAQIDAYNDDNAEYFKGLAQGLYDAIVILHRSRFYAKELERETEEAYPIGNMGKR